MASSQQPELIEVLMYREEIAPVGTKTSPVYHILPGIKGEAYMDIGFLRSMLFAEGKIREWVEWCLKNELAGNPRLNSDRLPA